MRPTSEPPAARSRWTALNHHNRWGPDLRGIILYTPGGYISAQLSKSDRPKFASDDWFGGATEDYANEATAYIAYSGPLYVDEDKQTLQHSMFVSLYPNWIGQTQPRAVKLDGDTLQLGTTAPLNSVGKVVNSVLIWHRAEANGVAEPR